MLLPRVVLVVVQKLGHLILERSRPPAVLDAARSFEQRALKLGRRGDALAEVLAGLKENENVVTTGLALSSLASGSRSSLRSWARTKTPSSL